MMNFGSVESTITAFEQRVKEGDARAYSSDKRVSPRFSAGGEMPTEASEWKSERAFIIKEIAYYKGLTELNHVS